MEQHQASMFLQSLRGNQAVIALAFLLLRSALTIEDLEQVTGIHNDTVRKAVKGLASKGLVFEQRGAHGRATWIPVGGTFFAQLAQSPKTSDSGELVSSSSNRMLLNASNLEEQEEAAESENFGLCAVEGEELSEGAIRANMAACDAVGICNPKKSRLSRLPHVTPELIRGHAKKARADGCMVGTAIYRIENNWSLDPEFLEEKKTFSWMCPKCFRPVTQCECESEE
jgi:hypothetical protein